jgi:diguanylate cyclase (GGDEF)-like protein
LEDLPEIQRTVFIQALTGAVASARKDASLLGILLIDITNLSRINHYHGYGTGDRILAAAYQRLIGISKLPDTVFRVGSHRFAFILPGLCCAGRPRGASRYHRRWWYNWLMLQAAPLS